MLCRHSVPKLCTYHSVASEIVLLPMNNGPRQEIKINRHALSNV